MIKRNFKFYLPVIICIVIGLSLLISGYSLFLTAGKNEILVTVGGILITLGFGGPIVFICLWLVHTHIV